MARKKKNDPVITINDNTKANKTKAEVKSQPVKRDEITIKPVNTQNKNVTSNDVKPVQKQSVMSAVNQKHADPMRAEKVKQKANYNKAKNGSNQKKINEDFKQIDKLYEDTRTTRSGETSTHRKTALSKDETAQRNAIRADIAQKYGLTEKEVDKLYNNYTKQETVKRKAENAKDHKIAATVGAIGDNLIASTMAVPHLVSDLINYNKGENVTSDDASHYFTNSRNATRQAVRDDIKTDFGKKAYDVTNMVGDIGANIGAGILTGGGSLVPSLLSGGQEAERSMVQSLDRGADVDDAFNAAITRGATQALMNKVGFKDRPVNGLGSAALNVLGNAGTEGLANVAQEMISNKTDDFFLGEDADLNTVFNQSMAETKYTGMPAAQRIAIAEEAVRDYKNQQYKSAGLQGALFGGLMSLGNNIPRLRNPEPVMPDAEPTKPTAEPETNVKPTEVPQTDDAVISDAIEQRQPFEAIEGARQNLLESHEPSIPVEVNPDDVIYHSGTLGRLNKSETRGKMHEGSRNTGYFGTGHYFVDNAHRGEIDNNSNYNSKPYTSVDISKYGNLYKADTDAKAEKLHGFSENYTRYVNTHNDRYYTDADGHIDEEARAEYLDDLYKTFKELFPKQPTTKEQFINQINAFRESEYAVDLLDRDDSVFTQLMKSMGYNGVDTTGTRFADTRYGTVIYDLDEDSILQSNVTDNEVKKGLMNTRVRNEGQGVFDTAEDDKIQKSLDAVSKRRAIGEEYRKLFDEPAFRKLKDELKETKDYLNRSRESLEEDIYTLNNSDAFAEKVEELKRIRKEFNLESVTDEEMIQNVRYELENDIEDTKELIAQREQRVKELQASVDEMEKASKTAYAQAKATVESISEKAGESAPENNVPHMNGTMYGEQTSVGDYFDENGNPITNPPTTPPTDGGVGMPRIEDNSNGGKVSQAYTNTGRYGGGWNEQEYKAYTDAQNYKYEDDTERNSVMKAWDMIGEKGADNVKADLLGKENLDHVEIDALMSLWRVTVANARAQEAQGIDVSALWKESNDIFKKIQTESTHNAQALQALAKWTRNTPEGLLARASLYVNGKGADGKTMKSALGKALEKYGKKNKVEFSDEFTKDFLNKASELDGMDMDSREAKVLMANLARMTTEQVPVKFREKLTTYMMDNMLGNFRTLISRNAGGNIGLNVVEQFAERPLAALIDMGLAKKTGIRTQAGFSKQGLLEYIAGFKKGLDEERADVLSGTKKGSEGYHIHTARTGENTFENALNMNRRIFKSNIGNIYDQFVRHGLSVGDRPFYEATYKQTLGDYQRMRQKGQFSKEMQNLSDEQFEEVAKNAAHLNALAAVYQNDSLLSNGLLELKNSMGDISKGVLGFDVLSQFSMPFVKTPANVADRLISYSPLGLVRTGVNTARRLHGGDLDDVAKADLQNYIANETSRGLIGTGIMGAGAAGLANGLISGKYSEDVDEKQAQRNANKQEHALNYGDNRQIDLSWIPVVGEGLVAGASAYEAARENEGIVPSMWAGLKAGGNAMFDQSMWQGAQRLFGGSNNSYNSDQSLMGNVGDTVASGLTQFIPAQSLARQIAQVSDENVRDVSNSGGREYYVNNLLNSIPGIRQDYLAPKIDTHGNEVLESQGRSIGHRIAEDMFLPGKVTEITSNTLDEEAEMLSQMTGNKSSYIQRPSKSYIEKESGKEFSDWEWVEYQKKYGSDLDKVGNAVLNNEYYQSLKNSGDYLAAEELLAKAYNASRAVTNSRYTDKELTGASKAYKEGGVNGLMDYLTLGKQLQDAGITNSEKHREELKEEGQTYIDQTVAMKDAGVTPSENAIYALDNGVTPEELGVLNNMTLSGGKKGDYRNYADLHKALPQVFVTPEEYRKFYDNVNTFDSKTKNLSNGDLLNFLNVVDPDYWQLLVDTWYNSDKYTVRRNLDGTYEKVLK